MVVDEHLLTGYELKVNKNTEADFREHLVQAQKYADHFEMEIHLINFWLEGMSPPVKIENV